MANKLQGVQFMQLMAQNAYYVSCPSDKTVLSNMFLNPLTAGHAFSRDRWSKSRAPVTRKCVTTFGPIKLSSGQ